MASTRILLTSLAFAPFASMAPSLAQTCIVEEAKLTASDAAPNDFFSSALSLRGDTLVSGAFGHDDLGLVSGAAFVFTRSGSTWTEEAELLASDGQAFDRFGGAVAVSGDTLLVGAGAAAGVGAVYAFERSGGSWTEQAKIQPPTSTPNMGFGVVALDGDTAVIGAPFDDANGPDSGSAWVYVRSGSSWAVRTKLAPSPNGAGDEFGASVAIEGDTILVGAPKSNDAVVDSGRVYVFVRSGGLWTQQATLESSDGGVFDQFASSVSLSGDTAVVGAFAADAQGSNSGAVYVFRRQGVKWLREAKLVPAALGAEDQFGCSVALSGDTIVAGARFDDDAAGSGGAAYVFRRDAAGWSELAKIHSSDISSFDDFGNTVAADGDTLVVGADRVDSVRGAAYVFVPPAEPGSAYCNCAAAPCGNADPTAGCANSTGVGARLVAHGSTLPDQVELVVHGLPARQFGAFFQADGAVVLPFGDGLRCADGGVIFLGLLPTEVAQGGSLRFGPCAGDPPISSVTGVVPGSGDTKRYQLWYRDPAGPCTSGFNLSNGYEITW